MFLIKIFISFISQFKYSLKHLVYTTEIKKIQYMSLWTHCMVKYVTALANAFILQIKKIM